MLLSYALLAQGTQIDYDRHVKPILTEKCFSCHGPAQQQSGLRLDLRQNALRGGDYGVVIVPGKSAESKLITRLTGSNAGLQMPPTGPLPPEEIATLRTWIDQGAEMPGRATSYAEHKKTTEPKVQSFLYAIHRHDRSAVGQALKLDPSLARSTDARGSTPLMHAAYAGSIELMRTLLAAGAEVKARNDRKASALHWAVADASKVKLLIASGAELDAKTVEGRTSLYLAAMQPAGTGIAQILLDAGADPNAATLTGTTPIFVAAVSSIETLRLLLARGADAKAKTATGATALMAAASKPGAIALLIASGADVKARTKRGETALAMASNYGDLEAVKLLIEKGADVNSVDYRGYTPLMHAAYREDAPVELIRLLLEKGADVKATGEGETALSLAAKRGETETTRLLREAQKGSPIAAR